MNPAAMTYWISDAEMQEMSRIANRPAFVAAGSLRKAGIKVRAAIMREKFRRAVLREQARAT